MAEATLPSDAAARLGDPLHPSSTLRTTAIRGRLWLGRERPFRLEPTDDPVFDRRLVLPDGSTGWLVLSYGGDPAPGRLRPILRVLRGPGGVSQDFVLPGASPGIAHWLGLIPRDATELHLCAAPDFVLERVGSRRESEVLAQCLL